ncbi:MAG: ATP-binding cassette domain-containing protein, partial [Clostridiales bacterium]|nr:ATP-binding cassette domain-containing protein [Clostridiales bacterium]
MALLTCNNLKKSFGKDIILENISFHINESSKTGIVGPNGAGKTTLFRLLIGEYLPDSGEIHKSHGLTMGYLPQNHNFDSSSDIWNELLDVYAPAFKIKSRLRDIEKDMGRFTSMDNPDYIMLANEYAILLERFEKEGGYDFESRIKGILNGLGFTEHQYKQPIAQLSGGQKTRVLLAKLLLQRPSLLLLDEPTNCLDLNAIEWLEQYLASYEKTVMLISHDRYFLDNVCNSIIEIEDGRNYIYNGNYSNYQRRRAERIIDQQKKFDKQQAEISRQKAIIERYRSFNREKSLRAAKSREKMLGRIELVDRPYDHDIANIDFSIERESGYKVLEIKDLSKTFGDNVLFKDVSFSLHKGDRVAIIGPNGVGKSTLLKIIMGIHKPSSGSIKFGAGVSIGYYDQDQSSLGDENTVLEEIWESFPNLTQTQIRNALASLLFTGDDVFKTINLLSGGERGKVLLTKLALSKDNFLILDEPTNHLDLDSKEQLEYALKNYPGTMLIVSHDRYFLDKTANRILVLEDGGITEYLGNYKYYVDKKQDQLKQAKLDAEKPVAKSKTQIQRERQMKRERQKKNAKVNEKIQALEKSIHELESLLKELETNMADPSFYTNSSNIKDAKIQYAQSQ